MNQAHLHLLVNHLPILGVLFGLLILGVGFFLKNPSVKRTSLGLFTFAALCAIPAYLSGEGAEEIAERLPGVTESIMESHEDLANIFLWIVLVLGLFSIATFLADMKTSPVSNVLYSITLAVALGSMVLAQQVGASGGKIRHTEIRSEPGNAGATDAPNNKGDNPQTTDDDD